MRHSFPGPSATTPIPDRGMVDVVSTALGNLVTPEIGRVRIRSEARRALRDLAASICPESLPEMSVYLAAERIRNSQLDAPAAEHRYRRSA